LWDAEDRHQVAHAQFALLQEMQDSEAGAVGEGAKELIG
jgi:hypothetical protein